MSPLFLHPPISARGLRHGAVLAVWLCGGCASPPAEPVLPLAKQLQLALDHPEGLPAEPSAVAVDPTATVALADAVSPAEAVTAVTAESGAPDNRGEPRAKASSEAIGSAAVQPAPAKPEPIKPEKPDPAKPAALKPNTPRTDPAKPAAVPAQSEAAKPVAQPKVDAAPPSSATAPAGADATELYYSGKRKLDSGDLKGAIADLQVSQSLRYSVRTLTLLGRAQFDAGQMASAEKTLKSAGTYAEAMLLLGKLYQQMGKPGQAKKVYEQFLSVHSDHPKAEWVRKLLPAL